MLDLNPIKERLKAATPGPWEFRNPDNFWQGIISLADGHIANGIDGRNICSINDGGQTTESAQANAELIVSAPTDISALITEVERLRGILKNHDNC